MPALVSQLRLASALATFAVGVAGPCFADAVILRNADRISGEIEQLENGRLKVRTSYAGMIEIDWKAVDRLSTDRPIEIEAESGLRLRGIIQESAEGLAILTAEKMLPMSRSDLVRMSRVRDGSENGFWRRLEGTADIGYTLTRGNSRLNQSSLGVSARYRNRRYQLQADLASLFSRQSDAPTTSRHTASIRHDFYLNTRAFTFALSGFERDDRQRLDLRTSLGGGLGWKLLKSARTDLALLGGFTFVNENLAAVAASDPSRSPSSGEALAGVDVETGVLTPLRLAAKVSAHPNLLERGRYRLVLETGLRVPLISRFSWNLRLFDRFDSRPRLPVQRNDYGAVSSFGVSF